MNDPLQYWHANLTRRHFFGRAALGIGTIALGNLMGCKSKVQNLTLSTERKVHFTPKAKRIIYLFQNGAPSHVDLFDYKPMLTKLHNTQIPASFLDGKRFSTMTSGQSDKSLMKEITTFQQHGESGAWVSSFLPKIASIADDLCFIKSMHTEAINHAPAITYLLTGSEMPGRPSLGAWLSYGLGQSAKDLPDFVVMTSRDKEASCGQIFYDFYWGSGFLPSKLQGVKFRSGGDPVLYLSNPPGVNRKLRHQMLDAIADLNEQNFQNYQDPEIQSRIAQYEMAYQMQMSVPGITDISKEPDHILKMYGPDVTQPGTYAYNCLMARKLIEKDVRFIQIMHAGWDQHRNLNTQLKIQCTDTDAPSAALVQDLKQRGLLDDTLVIWGGEFGRTPFVQGNINSQGEIGRDHHPYVFTIWMAGGGIKPGSFGASDEIGFNVTENGVHVHDLQATILHLLGIDHEQLTYKFQGRRFRLTDVFGKVVDEVVG